LLYLGKFKRIFYNAGLSSIALITVKAQKPTLNKNVKKLSPKNIIPSVVIILSFKFNTKVGSTTSLNYDKTQRKI